MRNADCDSPIATTSLTLNPCSGLVAARVSTARAGLREHVVRVLVARVRERSVARRVRTPETAPGNAAHRRCSALHADRLRGHPDPGRARARDPVVGAAPVGRGLEARADVQPLDEDRPVNALGVGRAVDDDAASCTAPVPDGATLQFPSAPSGAVGGVRRRVALEEVLLAGVARVQGDRRCNEIDVARPAGDRAGDRRHRPADLSPMPAPPVPGCARGTHQHDDDRDDQQRSVSSHVSPRNPTHQVSKGDDNPTLSCSPRRRSRPRRRERSRTGPRSLPGTVRTPGRPGANQARRRRAR